MLNKELIVRLQQLPPELPVLLDFSPDISEVFKLTAVVSAEKVEVPESVIVLSGSELFEEEENNN